MTKCYHLIGLNDSLCLQGRSTGVIWPSVDVFLEYDCLYPPPMCLIIALGCVRNIMALVCCLGHQKSCNMAPYLIFWDKIAFKAHPTSSHLFGVLNSRISCNINNSTYDKSLWFSMSNVANYKCVGLCVSLWGVPMPFSCRNKSIWLCLHDVILDLHTHICI